MKFVPESPQYRFNQVLLFVGALVVVGYLWYRDGLSAVWLNAVLTVFAVWIAVDPFVEYYEIIDDDLLIKHSTFARLVSVNVFDIDSVSLLPSGYQTARKLRLFLKAGGSQDVYITHWDWKKVRDFLRELGRVLIKREMSAFEGLKQTCADHPGISPFDPEAEVLPRDPTVLGFTIPRDIAR